MKQGSLSLHMVMGKISDTEQIFDESLDKLLGETGFAVPPHEDGEDFCY